MSRPATSRTSAWLGMLSRCLCVAALVAPWANVPAADKLGRLFFSNEERRTLDDLRVDYVEPPRVVVQPGQTDAPPVVDVISFDGKVERSDGSSTVWVNGRPVYTGDRTVEGIRIESRRGTKAETRFVLPPSDAGETQFSLKVGQKITVQSGKVLDSYESRVAEDAESIFTKETPPAAEPPTGSEDSAPAAGQATDAPRAPANN